MRVLVVDDDKAVLVAICELLSDAGVETESADNCMDAVPLLLHRKWDVLLSDLNFRGTLTGLDLADAATTVGIPSVIISGEPESREDVKARGHRFLGKPFGADALLTALAQGAATGPKWIHHPSADHKPNHYVSEGQD